jgi:hypothetical protein
MIYFHALLDALLVVFALAVRIAGILLGLFIVPAAIPFAKFAGKSNADGWELWHFPKWAWLWDNSRNGISGSQHNKAVNGAGRGFWWLYNWSALRNPFNNGSRFLLGFKWSDITSQEYYGTNPPASDFVTGISYYRVKADGCITYPGLVWTFKRGDSFYMLSAGWKCYKKPDDDNVGFTGIAFERCN